MPAYDGVVLSEGPCVRMGDGIDNGTGLDRDQSSRQTMDRVLLRDLRMNWTRGQWIARG